MNWDNYTVSEQELERLTKNNEPIPVASGRFVMNAGVQINSPTHQANVVYDGRLGALRKLNGYNPQFEAMPNRDLLLYNDHLLNPDINTLIVDGFFGTGKTSTVCSHLVYGLLDFLNGNGKGGIPMAYISKPHEGVGKSYGHLPGDLYEKTMQEFMSFTQYFERFGMTGLAEILMMRDGVKMPGAYGEILKKHGKMLEVLVFEYLRGRDIDRGWIILDEVQNTDRNDISTFISRTGDRAKVILLGDSTPTQIDKRGNTAADNGLQFAKKTYIGTKYTGYVEMQTIKHILRGQRVRDLFKALKPMMQ